MPSRMKRARLLLSAASSRSPWTTLISTCVWASDAVVKTCDFEVGMVVFRSMSFVATPPRVSMPSDSGVTSRSRTSFTSPLSTPAWMAAPTATTSSGFTPLWGSLPKRFFTASTTSGMRVMPPTRMTSFTLSAPTSASFRHCFTGPVDDPLVEVVAAEVGVPVGGLHLEDALTELQDRDVERAAAEVVHRDDFVLLLVEAVGERRGRRLVDDPEDLEPGDLAGVLGRLALVVIEVRGHGDDGLDDLVAEERLGVGLQLAQDHRRDLGWREALAVREDDLDPAVLPFGDLVRDEVLAA